MIGDHHSIYLCYLMLGFDHIFDVKPIGMDDPTRTLPSANMRTANLGDLQQLGVLLQEGSADAWGSVESGRIPETFWWFLGCCCEDDNYMTINDNDGRFLGIGASKGFRSIFLCSDFRGPDALIPRSGLRPAPYTQTPQKWLRDVDGNLPKTPKIFVESPLLVNSVNQSLLTRFFCTSFRPFDR